MDAFIEFCMSGSGGAAGHWKTPDPGCYLDKVHPGVEPTQAIVDQRFLPRAREGLIKFIMVKENPYQIIHSKPDGQNVLYEPNNSKFKDIYDSFIVHDLPVLPKALSLRHNNPLPALWSAEFVAYDSQGLEGEYVDPELGE